jgi:hypothetical protein
MHRRASPEAGHADALVQAAARLQVSRSARLIRNEDLAR